TMVLRGSIRRHRLMTGVFAGVAALLAVPLLAGAAPSSAPTRALDDNVHLNQIQVIGSHNSYHQLLTPKENDLRHAFLGDGDQGLTYRHVPLPVQFQSQKVRQIELDVFLDTAGGRYADPYIRKIAGEGPYDPAMKAPGIKVLHVQDVDYHSSCLTLVACLTEIKGWSDANPSHVPISVLVELKDDELHVGTLPIVQPEPWTTAGMDRLDAEIRSVMDPSDLITPDDVRGAHPSLSEAVTTDGWPTLGASRGKFLFLMDNGGAKRSAYRVGHSALQGRVLFTNASPGAADGGFIERNDPTDPSIPGLVSDGYVVRSRADADTKQARSNDTSMRDAALASGAQWVSTDYPVPGLAVGFTSQYFAEIPGGTVARCNPVNAPPSCRSAPLDTIFTAVAPPSDPFAVVPPPPPPGSTSSTVPQLIPPVVPGPSTTLPGGQGPGSVPPAGGASPLTGQPLFTG
ncbi:MAG: phosphatidylinositol-specific phospholipase C1-like protein, partial [Acidimicrobiales bacterium]